MELIERYLQAIGRQLPRSQRADILSELRSALMDTLEARSGGQASEEAVVRVIQEMGPPQQVAASYHAEGQYLIGPTLYPTFKLVAGIVAAAVVGAQLLALVIAVVIGQKPVAVWEVAGIFSSLPAALGMLVIVFAVLQRYDVRPELIEKDAVFDPRQLPALESAAEPVKRGEQIFGIIMGVVGLVFLAQFALGGGFRASGLFENPVIDQFFPWIVLSSAAGIGLDIWLLWQGRWQTATRLARLGVEAFSLAVLWVLMQGHAAWLAAEGVGGFFDSLRQMAAFTPARQQLFGMAAVQLALTVAFIVTAVEMAAHAYRLIRAKLADGAAPPAGASLAGKQG